jgi:chromosome segregation ATPase
MALNENQKDRKSKIYLLITILVIFLINIGLIYKLVSNNKKLVTTEEELIDTRQELAELEGIKQSLEMELNDLKGENEYMDSIISERDAVIQEKMAKINLLLSRDGVTKADLAKARKDIAALKEERDRFLDEIDRLNIENERLKLENEDIRDQFEKAEVRSRILEDNVIEKDKQIKVGERLFTKSLTATATKSRLIGSEEKETTRFKRMENLEIEAIIANNDLSPQEEKKIYLKVVLPNKSTLKIESLGSGNFSYQGGESVYTSMKTFNFANKNEKIKWVIPKHTSMSRGTYTVNLYSESHLMGTSQITLR